MIFIVVDLLIIYSTTIGSEKPQTMQIAEFSSLPRSRFLAGKELHLTSLKTRLRGMFGVPGIKA